MMNMPGFQNLARCATTLLLTAVAAPVVAQADRPLADLASLDRYRADNRSVERDRARPRIVFIGDSITEGWTEKLPAYFRPGLIGRGIGGQVTAQLLIRFRQDVVALKPDVVHIMGGTNDIAERLPDEEVLANFQSMIDLARAHGIRVIVASIPPADRYPWKPGLDTGHRIVAINRQLQRLAQRNGAIYADYWAAMNDGTLGMRPGLASDRVHPTVEGYRAMAPVCDRAVAAALGRRPAPRNARP